MAGGALGEAGGEGLSRRGRPESGEARVGDGLSEGGGGEKEGEEGCCGDHRCD